MRKSNLVLLSFFVFIMLNSYSQNEKIEYDYCSFSDIEAFAKNNKDLHKIFPQEGEKDLKVATLAGWSGFNEIFGLEGLGIGLISEVFDPNVFKKINKTMGNIGVGFILLQMAIDYSEGNYLAGATNASKSVSFWAIGTYGWKALKIANFGMVWIDYSLTKFGQAGVAARTDAWGEAYYDYYNSSKSGAKLNLATWKEKFKNVKSDEDIKKIISSHLLVFWNDSERTEYVKKRLAMWNIIPREPIEGERQKIQDSYLKYSLIPYLTPLFTRMSYEAQMKKKDEICKQYEGVVNWMNSRNRVSIKPEEKDKNFGVCSAYIQVRADGKIKRFITKSTNESGEYTFKFTRYSLLNQKITEARLVIRKETDEGTKVFKQKIDIGKKNNKIKYTLEEEKPNEPEDFPDEPDDPQDDEVQEDNESSIEEAEDSKTKSNGQKILKENIDNTISIGENVISEEFNFSSNMKAVFEIGKPMTVEVKKVKETSTHFYGLIVHKKFMKKNELIIDKKDNSITITYKLKGPFAPELICKSPQQALGIYSGDIVTNNEHAVKVGKFSFKFIE